MIAAMTITQDLVGDNSWPTGPLRSGPLLGEVGETDAFVWAQARDTTPLVLSVHRPDGSTIAISRLPLTTNGLCVVFHVTGLVAGTACPYTLSSQHGTTPTYTLRAGLPATATKAKIVFGSCVRIPASGTQSILTSIGNEHADVFLMTGDNTYFEDPGDLGNEDVKMLAHLKYRNIAELRNVIPSVSTLGIWDDHDFGSDDRDNDEPILFSQADDSLSAFKHMWAQRTYGLVGPGTAGIYSHARYGPVEIFLTDGRFHRSEFNHILGPAQLSWLKTALAASTAPVKLIVSGSVVLPQFVKAIHTWEGWERDAPGELSELLAHIEAHDIRGVAFVSGDLHLAYLMHRPGTAMTGGRQGPDYWELISSPLSSPVWDYRVRLGPNEPTYDPYCLTEIASQNYGVLDVDLNRGGKELILTLKNAQGIGIVSQNVDRSTLQVRPAPAPKLTAVVWPNGKAYFFKGSRYVRYTVDPAHEGVDAGYPMPIAGHWTGLPDRFTENLDAAVAWPNGRAYFFRGNGYVGYTIDPSNEGVPAGYPKYVTEWPGLWSSGIDAAVVWSNGSAYFFKGLQYVRYDMDPAHEGVMAGYPKPIAGNWPGLAAAFPNGIDAVVVWPNGKAYFFKGDQYVRYTIDPADEGVDPGYPKPIVGHWPGLDAL